MNRFEIYEVLEMLCFIVFLFLRNFNLLNDSNELYVLIPLLIILSIFLYFIYQEKKNLPQGYKASKTYSIISTILLVLAFAIIIVGITNGRFGNH